LQDLDLAGLFELMNSRGLPAVMLVPTLLMLMPFGFFPGSNALIGLAMAFVAGQIALGRRRVCPACFERADPDPGYVISGREAWGCSKWKQGCKLRIPFIIEGQRLSEDDARRLLGRDRATRYLRGLHSARGNLPVSRIVLRPLEEPCWKLEAKGSSAP